MALRIITTEDGSHSLYHEELNETYHSTRGAWGESTHVFIKEGLEYWLSHHESEQVRVLEVGLGTGLNALLTALTAESRNQKIHFTSLEPYPVEKDLYEKLNYPHTVNEEVFLRKVHEVEWEEEIPLSHHFQLYKTTSRLEDFLSTGSYQIIYFDAFAPSKQPEIWSIANLKKCYALLDKGGVLTSYCAQGQFKRNLAQVGFQVETLLGAMGKKEMVRGTRMY